MSASESDKPIWVADAETDPFKHGEVPHPFIWGVYNGASYREFTGTGPAFRCTESDIAELIAFLREQDVILYAHNGGKFDWHFLSPHFEPDSDILIIHGRLAKFTIGKCEFRDSFNLMPVALEQYQKQKFDYTKMEASHRHNHMPEIRDYLKSDCVNLWNMVDGFVKSYGLHITQASAAMHFWKHRLKHKVPRSGPGHYDNFAPYYFGGRVQCFERGEFACKAISVDIKSAYPDAMLRPHPYSLGYNDREGTPRKGIEQWGPMLFTIECRARGAFPYRATNGSLYFPDDNEARIYNVTGWELQAAIETHTLTHLKILHYIEFEQLQNFSDYVLYLWNLREQFRADGDDGGVFYIKIMLNALYGKFASDPRKHHQYTLRPGSELKKIIEALGPNDSFRHFREWLIVESEIGGNGKGRFYNLATAASITGFVRAKLWRAICGAKRPLYCDTDSVTALGFGNNLPMGNNLGEWSIEHEYDRVVIAGKKLYAFHMNGQPILRKSSWKIASKGARLNHKQIMQIARGKLIHFKNDAPTFSASKSQPVFVDRHIKSTAADIRIVPREVDPKYVVTEKA
jgi:hypothetical protein